MSDLVTVVWRDACFHLTDVPEVMHVHTTGHLIRVDDDAFVVASGVIGDHEDYRAITTIPSECVVTFTKLKVA